MNTEANWVLIVLCIHNIFWTLVYASFVVGWIICHRSEKLREWLENNSLTIDHCPFGPFASIGTFLFWVIGTVLPSLLVDRLIGFVVLYIVYAFLAFISLLIIILPKIIDNR